MKRFNRKYNQRSGYSNDIGRRPNIELDRILRQIGVPDCQREDFLRNSLQYLWDNYSKQRMDRKIIVENEIRGLGIRLQNGTANKYYKAEFDLPLDAITNIRLEGCETLSLLMEINENGHCTVSGMPKQSGDFTLTLKFDVIGGEAGSEIPIPIAFNPDPRSLWRNLPTDRNIMYYKPDTESEYIEIDDDSSTGHQKDIVAASKRGRSHAQEGKPRDDHFKLSYCENSGWYIIAVADGAGSAPLSRKGSEVACQTVVDYCRERLTDNPSFDKAIRLYNDNGDDSKHEMTKHVIEIVLNGAIKAHNEIAKLVTLVPDSKLKDFATTLMFAICKKFDFGWFIASFWVGDGAMCVYDQPSHTVKLLGNPDEGEFSGQTRFLTMKEIFTDRESLFKRICATVMPDFTALFLMTDGVSDPLFETDRNLRDYRKWDDFYQLIREGFKDDGIGGVDLTDNNPAAEQQLLQWLDFWKPGNHDDRTIAILY